MTRRAISTKRTRGRCDCTASHRLERSRLPTGRQHASCWPPMARMTWRASRLRWVAGRQIPVDPKGNFAAEEMLPAGAHSVEVAVLDDAGNGSLYLRDLEFKRTDLFYVGIADLTVSKNSVSGPAKLQEGENNPYPYDSSLDGRLAFYL